MAVGMTFRTGKFAGVPLTEIPKQYLEWAYVNLEEMSPDTRSQTGLLLANWLGNISKAEPTVGLPAVVAEEKQGAPDLAEQVMQALEFYAGNSDGGRARDVLCRLYGRQ